MTAPRSGAALDSHDAPATAPVGSSHGEGPARVGVAVKVPEPWGSRLQDYRTSLGDDATQVPTHITLVPPVDLGGDDEVARVLALLEDAAGWCAPFAVHLRGTGTFRPVSPVVFVAVVEGISCLEMLAARTRQGPLELEAEFPYHPHVTIGHHLDDATLDRAFDEQQDFDCAFTVESLTLYRHDDGDGWRVWRDFALRG